MNANLEAHVRAEKTHRMTAQRHLEAAERWARHGDDERAALERRNARIEVDAADLERDRAELERRRPIRL